TSEGLVIMEPQRGFRVSPISVEDLKDLSAVRANIESQCLERSILAGDVAWEGRVVAAFHELARTPERVEEDEVRISEAWASTHQRFHVALVEACDSPWLLRLRDLLFAQSERYRRLSVPLEQNPRNLAAEHHGIMEATVNRDIEKATQLLRGHFGSTTRILLESKAVSQGVSENINKVS
ncbi:FCD domain-containing protein, partial [Rhodobacteraceae bacterium]|nr:FCD domain-containing protein [Paracoccaceae bacterium]